MREIKFRAWRTDIKEMLNEPYDGEYLSETTPLNSVIKGCREYEAQILMQYTGLKDKNGTEIWEGDIVLYSIAEKAYKVGFSNGCFCLLGEDGLPVDLDWGWEYLPTSEDMKVIGNIWENPELLKKVK